MVPVFAPSSSSTLPQAAVSALRVDGANLLHRAEMIGDTDDLHFWQGRRQEWLRESARLVERHHGPAAARALREMVHSAQTATDWRHELTNDLAGLRDALRLFDDLDASGA